MRIAAVLTASILLLAGCTEPEKATQSDGDETALGLTNTAPVATLVASLSNGTAPLLVNLTLDATDAEGDNLTWAISLNGTVLANGTALPASIGHNLTENGTFVFHASVSDGNLTGNATTAVSVVAAASVPEAPPRPYGIVAEYTFSGSLPLDGATTGAHAFDVPADADHIVVVYTSEHIGLFSAVAEVFDASGASALYSLDECGVNFTPGMETEVCTMELATPLSPGAWSAKVSYQAGQVTEDYTFDITVSGFQ